MAPYITRRLRHFRHTWAIVILLVAVFVHVEWALGQVVTEEEVTFPSGEITLHGTILMPERSDKSPAIVLVHGAGMGLRSEYRSLAEALAQEGFIALIYDKRTEGYSVTPTGKRSYSLLAEDALAAVRMLRARPDVNPDQVGLWGLSEGGWVAPLAASRSTDVAFVIAVAGGGVGPLEQSAWATESELIRRGVSSPGALRALADHAYRFLASAELFAEATFDPAPIFERLGVPILALWGSLDRIMPYTTSAAVMQQSLESGGNRHYVLSLIPDASHAAAAVSGGQVVADLAPGYVETMTAWVREVLAGNQPGPKMDHFPADQLLTRPWVKEAQGFARWEAQLGFLAALHVAFGGHLIRTVVRRLRGSQPKRPARRYATLLALVGLLTSWGVFGYTGIVAATGGEAVGVVIGGRPLAWLILQILAALVLLMGVLLALELHRKRRRGPASVWADGGLVLVGAVAFLPWSIWWQLFSL